MYFKTQRTVIEKYKSYERERHRVERKQQIPTHTETPPPPPPPYPTHSAQPTHRKWSRPRCRSRWPARSGRGRRGSGTRPWCRASAGCCAGRSAATDTASSAARPARPRQGCCCSAGLAPPSSGPATLPPGTSRPALSNNGQFEWVTVWRSVWVGEGLTLSSNGQFEWVKVWHCQIMVSLSGWRSDTVK